MKVLESPARRDEQQLKTSLNPFAASLPTLSSAFWLNGDAGKLRNVWVWGDADTSKGVVILIHGYGEHALRHAHVAEAYAVAGLCVYAADLASHGENADSKGFMGCVRLGFDNLYCDAEALATEVRTRHPQPLPLFIHAHSMGGLVGLDLALRLQSTDTGFGGVVFSAPAFRLYGKGLVPPECADVCFFRGLAKFAGLISAGYWPNPAAPAKEATRVPPKGDKRHFGGMIVAGFGSRLLVEGDMAIARFPDLTAPFLVTHGDNDKIVRMAGSERLHADASTAADDKTIVRYPGALHELQYEDNWKDIVATMVGWVEGRLKKL